MREGGGEMRTYAVKESFQRSYPSSLSSLPLSYPSPSPGIDVEKMKGVEEAAMLEDAQRLKNDPSLKPLISVGGATPLHIAAAKNYLRVLK